MRQFPILCAAAFVTACSASSDLGTSPFALLQGVNDSLALSVAVSPAAIVPGDTARISVTVTNRTDRAIVIHFPDSCQLLYEVRDAAGRPAPDRGGFACFDAVTSLRLEPRASKSAEHRWTALEWTDPPSAYRPRPPGEYRVYGLLGLFGPLLRTRPVTVTVLAR